MAPQTPNSGRAYDRKKTLAEDLGEVIRNLRLEANFSQKKLAERCDLNRTYLGAIERGEKAITVETAVRIADGLGVRLSVIILRVESLRLKEWGDARSQINDH